MSTARRTPAIGELGWRPTEVHPLAALFPMMAEDELADLAADIKAHGLLHPIVIDDQGLLIDGRNRLQGCELAEVEPQFEMLNGVDAVAYIVSANLARRNLTKGQQAMALAMIYPEPDKRGRGNKGKAAETSDFSQKRLSQARSVLRHSQALAEDVIAARKSLDAALTIVETERRDSQSTEAKLAELRRAAPDLADLVTEERLTLDEAHASFMQRKADAEALEANQRETILRLTESAWSYVTAWASSEFLSGAQDRLQDKAFREEWLRRLRFDPARLPDIERGARAFAELIQSITGGKS